MVRRVARVFPRQTSHTPTDEFAFTSGPDMFTQPFDEVHVSCTFTWDRSRAEVLADLWRGYSPDVRLGGPAYDDAGDEFSPGMFLKSGYTMTSRGCPYQCPFCFVPKREGKLRELAIESGNVVCDNNLLACSESHITQVFDMLEKERKIRFLGGLDVRLLSEYHISRLVDLGSRLNYFYIAYDSAYMKDRVLDVLVRCYSAGLTQSKIGCYVLIGYDGDTPQAADERCEWVFVNGGLPYAMYYRGPDANPRVHRPVEWRAVVKQWSSPWATFSSMRNGGPRYHPKFIRGRYAE